MDIENIKRVKDILHKHKLSYTTLTKSVAGFINQVFLTEDYVVKMYDKSNQSGYNKELWFYKEVHPDYAPRLMGYGEDYIVLERIKGHGLYHVWPNMDDAKREQIVSKIAYIIKELAKVDCEEVKALFEYQVNWKQSLLDEMNRHFEELKKNNGIPVALGEEVRNYITENAKFLGNEQSCLVYTDLHFDNLIITEDEKIYLIDYEMLKVAPKDYVLDVWQRMTIHPFTYANLEDHEKTLPKDYVHILEWLERYAPEVFEHQHVKERVNIYSMLYELNILRSYPNADWPIYRIQRYLSKSNPIPKEAD